MYHYILQEDMHALENDSFELYYDCHMKIRQTTAIRANVFLSRD